MPWPVSGRIKRRARIPVCKRDGPGRERRFTRHDLGRKEGPKAWLVPRRRRCLALNLAGGFHAQRSDRKRETLLAPVRRVDMDGRQVVLPGDAVPVQSASSRRPSTVGSATVLSADTRGHSVSFGAPACARRTKNAAPREHMLLFLPAAALSPGYLMAISVPKEALASGGSNVRAAPGSFWLR